MSKRKEMIEWLNDDAKWHRARGRTLTARNYEAIAKELGKLDQLGVLISEYDVGICDFCTRSAKSCETCNFKLKE